ncbi:response regulator [Natrinema halophilum]|uniref:response regulator n=1 Tax=Natrinema halophilum TaxID=1699371 RepID=UPI001F24CA59|nr:response regulator [Natrinema halophilum]UHQ96265.1 response regulator [Natrinema halophilum]
MTSEFDHSEPADILLVEDNPGDIRLTKEAFKDQKIANTLHVVENGVDALDFLFQRNDYADAPRPDLVLLDLNLPRKNGDEVLKELHEDPERRRIPVIILTSSDAEIDIIQSYELCARGYLTKPVDPDEFIDTIRELERFWLSVMRLPTDEDFD